MYEFGDIIELLVDDVWSGKMGVTFCFVSEKHGKCKIRYRGASDTYEIVYTFKIRKALNKYL